MSSFVAGAHELIRDEDTIQIAHPSVPLSSVQVLQIAAPREYFVKGITWLPRMTERD
jgi:hypothetical protein